MKILHPGAAAAAAVAAAAAKSLQSCPIVCNPIDGSPWGSPIPGILQVRTLEWVAISFSKAWKWKVHECKFWPLIPYLQSESISSSQRNPSSMPFIFTSLITKSEKAMASHSSTLAWKIPWMEEPGRLQSMGSLSRTRLSDFTFTFYFHALEKEMATHSCLENPRDGRAW